MKGTESIMVTINMMIEGLKDLVKGEEVTTEFGIDWVPDRLVLEVMESREVMDPDEEALRRIIKSLTSKFTWSMLS